MNIMMVQHNAEAMFGNRELKVTTGLKAKSSERLASGYRINRAADDAAGLSISEKLRWQVRGLDKASTNIQDGISFLQTGEGALNEVHDMLGRIKELSIQAANDTNTDIDRAAINEEVQQIKKEMNRIFNDTEFNTIKIFRAPYIPDIENTPDDYKMFNLGNSSTAGGIMVNNKRYTWDELGVDNSTSDWEKKITDDNGELIYLKLDKGADYSSMRRVYELDADDTGIKINELYAAKWTGSSSDNVIQQNGDEYSFTYHGMDISISVDSGDTRADVISRLQRDGISVISWNAIPAGYSQSGAVTSSADSMTVNVTNTNKNKIENQGYLIIPKETGLSVAQTDTSSGSYAVTSGTLKQWETFSDSGSYPIKDWGTENEGSNPVTLDDSATYHFRDDSNWDGIAERLEFDFHFNEDEVSRAEAIIGLNQELTGADVYAPIQSVTDNSANVDVSGYSGISFHFQRDRLLRNFGDNGSDAPMNATVTRTKVYDDVIADYEKRRELSEAYLKNTRTITNTRTTTYGDKTRQYYDADGTEITSDNPLYAEIEAASTGVEDWTGNRVELLCTTTHRSIETYLVNAGQSPATVPDTDTYGTDTPITNTSSIEVNGVTYEVKDTYEVNVHDNVHTENTFDGVNYYKIGSSYIAASNQTLYMEDSDTSNETRSTDGMRYKTAASDLGIRYVQSGEGYAQNKVYQRYHYEYEVKNSSGTTIMTGRSELFVDTSANIKDSYLDSGSLDTSLPPENVEDKITLTTSTNGSTTEYTTNLAQRFVTLTGNAGYSGTKITLKYNDRSDTSATINASVGLTITPDGNATRTYTKTEQTKGSVGATGLKVKIDPPEKTLMIQAGALGLQGIELKWTALSNSIIGMGSVQTTSAGLSQAAIASTDEAIDHISTVRSGFGAQQNRLEHAYAIDRIIQENTDTGESRIRDTDMARETVIYSKYRLLEQVGQTLLAQANQNKMGILNLLQ